MVKSFFAVSCFPIHVVTLREFTHKANPQLDNILHFHAHTMHWILGQIEKGWCVILPSLIPGPL